MTGRERSDKAHLRGQRGFINARECVNCVMFGLAREDLG
jgi:hypothetical protein